MSAPGEWHAVDANPVPLPTIIVSSSDLFDGELFGDELLDIYNSSVDGHGDSEELSDLLADVEGPKKGEEEADMLDAMDDGFGAFRPSTSFNDLSTLLSAPAAEGEVVNPMPVAPVSAPVEEMKSAKKRPAVASVAPPSPKRKALAKNVPVKPKTKSPTDKANTPNPLTSVVAAFVKVAPVPPLSTTVVTASPVPIAITSSSAVSKQEESDFKTIAQAAVSSLILSAGTIGSDATVPVAEDSSLKVDTSTAHIKALTGNNWVAACAGANEGIVSVPSDVDSKGNRNRRQNLTPDERARQNRDRNREHARNTRLRKKAYVEELKRTLTELVSQRDAADFEKRQTAQRELEQREVRFRVIEEFLKLRGRNETNFARWAAILEDGFSLTLPTTDFRQLAQGDSVPGFEQVLNGVSDVMADASIFSTFLQTLGNGEEIATCQFQCDRKKFFMDGCQAVLEWTATSVGAVKKGASAELTFKGIVRGKFSPASNKLLSAEMTCDTGAVLVQLQKMVVTSPFDTVHLDTAFFEVAAAQAAASQADAILDSLQMPCLPATVPASVIVHPSSSSSEGSCDKGELDSDESVTESGGKFSMENGTSLTGPVFA